MMEDWFKSGTMVNLLFDRELERIFGDKGLSSLNRIFYAKIKFCDKSNWLPYELQIYDKENKKICEVWAQKYNIEEMKSNNDV